MAPASSDGSPALDNRQTAHGTLYRALGPLDAMGLLQSRWEDHAIAARESRPVRRLYTLTAVGDAALADARRLAADALRAKRTKRRLAPVRTT